MTQPRFVEAIAISGRVLGGLFFYAPQNENMAPLIDAFRDGSWAQEWPEAAPFDASLIETFQTASDEPLSEAYQRLFVGPYALPAPPWGSVWLDKESVLFGDSTLALRQWMRENNIAFEAQQNEPEDHFGTLLMLSAWLKENGREEAWQQLLAWHLLPWSGRFLQTFIENADHPFYRALGQLTQQTLAFWQSELLIPVAEKKLYR
ncbi:MAG: Tat proofreading chaperone DmsD [Scandinavium sp.]|uniref:Tat proofreading chaperone DmsD n=1 Tax=Scandinavium sp. TaxID=2830653 RepID=UPI003F31EFF8